MALRLKDLETERLAHRVAALTGETLAEAVRRSLADRLQAEQIRRGRPVVDRAAIDSLLARFDALPVLDDRSADTIVGYVRNGVPA